MERTDTRILRDLLTVAGLLTHGATITGKTIEGGGRIYWHLADVPPLFFDQLQAGEVMVSLRDLKAAVAHLKREMRAAVPKPNGNTRMEVYNETFSKDLS